VFIPGMPDDKLDACDNCGWKSSVKVTQAGYRICLHCFVVDAPDDGDDLLEEDAS
jgi:hypothetical protein